MQPVYQHILYRWFYLNAAICFSKDGIENGNSTYEYQTVCTNNWMKLTLLVVPQDHYPRIKISVQKS